MANHLQNLLTQWYPQRDELQWVLATIIETQGSSYRKAGAMMLINSIGQYHGLLSGGCLESDIMRQARRCWDDGNNRVIAYDMREEEDLAWQLGIGCGGLVRILLQPCSADNDYLSLISVKHAFEQGRRCLYGQRLCDNAPHNYLEILAANAGTKIDEERALTTSSIRRDNEIIHHLTPPIRLAVFGGGIDAIPLVAMAGQLGWTVTLVDPRPSYARPSVFGDASRIIRVPETQWQNAPWLEELDCAMIMTHNVSLDAASLACVQQSRCRLVGLLGPGHRTARVLREADLSTDTLKKPLSNPAGLRLGGELPESIALAVLAEFHAALHHADGRSISGQLSP